jgi:ureidoacrylate peracid hydrolase
MNKKTALLVIDMQNDFVEEGAIIEVKGIRNRITQFKEFINKMREKGITIIYTRHIYEPETDPISVKMFGEKVEKALSEGSYDSEINQNITPNKKDIIIKKRRYDAFIGTELELILKAKEIENLIITGTMTNICCESTARTAMMKGFNVLFTSDLTFTSDRELHLNTLKNISTHFGKVMTSEEIFRFF